MARTTVARTTCDRCDAIIEEAADVKDGPAAGGPMLVLQAAPLGIEKTVTFNDLCVKCREALINYLKRVLKEPQPQKEKGSPAEAAKPEPTEAAAAPATQTPPPDDKKGAPADTGASKDAAKGGSKQRPAN